MKRETGHKRRKKSARAMRSFDDYMHETLQDPAELQAYLDLAVESYERDGNWSAFLMALRTAAKAKGGIGKLSEKTPITREHMYRILSQSGNPRLDTLGLILKQLGLRLSITVDERKENHQPRDKKLTEHEEIDA